MNCGLGYCDLNDEGSYCKCFDGFFNRNLDPKLPCECPHDFDCGYSGTCVTDDKSYSCQCDEGYKNWKNETNLPCGMFYCQNG